MTIDEKWGYDLAAAEIATGKRYAIGDRLTEYDGRECGLAARESLLQTESMLRGAVGGDHRAIRIAWTYVSDQMRAIADEVRPELEKALS